MSGMNPEQELPPKLSPGGPAKEQKPAAEQGQFAGFRYAQRRIGVDKLVCNLPRVSNAASASPVELFRVSEPTSVPTADTEAPSKDARPLVVVPVEVAAPLSGRTPLDAPAAGVPVAVLLMFSVATVREGNTFVPVLVRKALNVALLDPVFVTSTDPARSSVITSLTLVSVPNAVLKPLKVNV